MEYHRAQVETVHGCCFIYNYKSESVVPASRTFANQTTEQHCIQGNNVASMHRSPQHCMALLVIHHMSSTTEIVDAYVFERSDTTAADLRAPLQDAVSLTYAPAHGTGGSFGCNR